MVELKWKRVKGVISYLIEMTTNDPAMPDAAYELTGITHRGRYTVEGLTPGTYYRFRVKAVGRKSESGYSDPALIMAA